jgi:hypothetical protein
MALKAAINGSILAVPETCFVMTMALPFGSGAFRRRAGCFCTGGEASSKKSLGVDAARGLYKPRPRWPKALGRQRCFGRPAIRIIAKPERDTPTPQSLVSTIDLPNVESGDRFIEVYGHRRVQRRMS